MQNHRSEDQKGISILKDTRTAGINTDAEIQEEEDKKINIFGGKTYAKKEKSKAK